MASSTEDKAARAERIRRARMDAGFSKAEVARRAALVYTTYDGYEKGYRDADPEALKRIADALGVDVKHLLYGEPQGLALTASDGGSEAFTGHIPDWQPSAFEAIRKVTGPITALLQKHGLPSLDAVDAILDDYAAFLSKHQLTDGQFLDLRRDLQNLTRG